MRKTTALKVIRNVVDYYIKNRLAFNANLYETVQDDVLKKDYDERKRIEEAWATIYYEVADDG